MYPPSIHPCGLWQEGTAAPILAGALITCQSLDTHISLHMVCRSLLDPSIHPHISTPAHLSLLPGSHTPIFFPIRDEHVLCVLTLT